MARGQNQHQANGLLFGTRPLTPAQAEAKKREQEQAENIKQIAAAYKAKAMASGVLNHETYKQAKAFQAQYPELKVVYNSSQDSILFTKQGLLHREDGPAVITPKQTKWFQNGDLHREDGPAVVGNNESVWYQFGKKHRADGPAMVSSWTDKQGLHESKRWFYEGQKHSLTEPAVVKLLNGKVVSEEFWFKGSVLNASNANEALKAVAKLTR